MDFLVVFDSKARAQGLRAAHVVCPFPSTHPGVLKTCTSE